MNSLTLTCFATFTIVASASLISASDEPLARGFWPASQQAPSIQMSSLHADWWLASTAAPNQTFGPVTVPSTVVGALVTLNKERVTAGLSPVFTFPDAPPNQPHTDPFYAKNLYSISAANFSTAWTFSTSFTVPAEDASGFYHIMLFNGVNYEANISLNGINATANVPVYDFAPSAPDSLSSSSGTPPPSHSSSHSPDVTAYNDGAVIGGIRRYAVDVDNLVQSGSVNQLTVTVVPPIHSWSTDLSFSFEDWAPFPADNSMGLWRDVELLSLPKFQTASTPPQPLAFFADGIVVETLLPPLKNAEGGNAELAFVNIHVTLRCFPAATCATVSTKEVGLVLTAATTYPGLSLLSFPVTNQTLFEVTDDQEGAEAQFTWSWQQLQVLSIENPLLWWPWEMGSANLFNISIQLEGRNISRPGARFGLRQMSQGEASGGALQLYVNNIPLHVRGGGWAPDLFYRFPQESNASLFGSHNTRIRHQLELVKHMNLNTIRLEGKFEYRDFFEIASEMGLLVIPGIECCTSWQNWPQWTTAMKRIARASVRDQTRRLGIYACNVAFLASSDELPPPQIESMYRDVMRKERWPNPIISAASSQESTISGSSGTKMTGPYSWVPPVYWLADVNGLTMDFGGAWGFLTEGGPGEAPMTFESWQRTVPAAHLWDEAEGSLSSWWSAHMGNPKGVFYNLRRYTPALNARFGPSNSAQEYCYKSQVQNYEGIRAMFEGYSKMKHANATGVIQWMMNDAYPSHLWHLYDYYLVGGGGFYGARSAGEPLHPMLSYVDGTVSLINNRFQSILDSVTVTIFAYAVSPTFQVMYQSSGFVLAVVPADAVIDVGAVSFEELNRLAAQFTPRPNGGASAYVVEVRLSMGDFTNASSNELPSNASSWYLLSTTMDVVNFSDSNNLWTNCSQWADFTSLRDAPRVTPEFSAVVFTEQPDPFRIGVNATLSNPAADALAMYVQVLAICEDDGLELAPSFWSDNFFMILPNATKTISGDVFRGNCTSVEIKAKALTDVLS